MFRSAGDVDSPWHPKVIEAIRDATAMGGVLLRNLFAIGALTQGAFWECTAAPEIRVRAAAIAALLSAPLAVA